jgi:2-desacetyl-2-hydroxyethyl bacteriochlorophyllide A dehydrogenase
MYNISVKNRMFIGHSFDNGETYGMTLVFDIIFYGKKLDSNNMLINIDIASEEIQKIVDKYNYKNLDNHDDFKNKNSTIEYIAYVIAKQIKKFVIDNKYVNINKLKVKINESDIAYTEYEINIEHKDDYFVQLSDDCSYKTKYYLFDLDNTLHHNSVVLKEIVNNIHKIFAKRYNIDKIEADALYKEYGDSIYGLIKKKNLTAMEINDLYKEIYNVNLDIIRKNKFLYQYLSNLKGFKWITSNSPRFYIEKILNMLGLDNIFNKIICPSIENNFLNKSDNRYFKTILASIDSKNDIYFFDDNIKYVNMASDIGINSYLVNKYCNLELCISKTLNIIDSNFSIDNIKFMKQLKEIVMNSYNHEILNKFKIYLNNLKFNEINIIEIGYGLSPISNIIIPCFKNKKINYNFYDIDNDCIEYLKKSIDLNKQDENHFLFKQYKDYGNIINFHYHNEDIMTILTNKSKFDIVCGSTILDMIDYKTVFNHFKKTSPDVIFYFLANYSGITTRFSTYSQNLEITKTLNNKLTQTYNKAMIMKNQFTENFSYEVINYLNNYTNIDYGNSDWKFNSHSNNILGSNKESNNNYLLKVINNYIISNAICELSTDEICFYYQESFGKSDMPFNDISDLFISNIDFVAKFDYNKINNTFNNSFLQITKPYVIDIIKETINNIKDDELLIQTVYSGISTGTELKIFKGDIENNIDLDVNFSIDNKYPLKYGYCCVGNVIKVGKEVKNIRINSKAFVFYHHSKYVVTKEENVIIIPNNIDLKDAIFFPNMETAVSLVQDMMINIGDNVSIYGQGCVGLLVNMILSLNKSIIVNIFELLDNRIQIAQKVNPNCIINPYGVDSDIILEITGSIKVLNNILNNSSFSQKIVIGSWYENKESPILLGTKFHRNHLNIVTSQVSNLSNNLLGRWNKKRRYDFVWELIKKLKPSKKIPINFENINDSQKIFDQLKNKQKFIQIAFKY